jgi:hypothetical protein
MKAPGKLEEALERAVLESKPAWLRSEYDLEVTSLDALVHEPGLPQEEKEIAKSMLDCMRELAAQ